MNIWNFQQFWFNFLIHFRNNRKNIYVSPLIWPSLIDEGWLVHHKLLVSLFLLWWFNNTNTFVTRVESTRLFEVGVEAVLRLLENRILLWKIKIVWRRSYVLNILLIIWCPLRVLVVLFFLFHSKLTSKVRIRKDGWITFHLTPCSLQVWPLLLALISKCGPFLRDSTLNIAINES